MSVCWGVTCCHIQVAIGLITRPEES